MNLPNFLIIGANKAGTSSLSYYCGQHPDIFICPVKEPMFFTSSRVGVRRGGETTLLEPYFCFTLSEYIELFSGTDKPLRGEASTAYLVNPNCALWIKKILPDVKLIAVLRNPLDRAFSAYKMYHGRKVEKRTFEEAVLHELKFGTNGIQQGQHYLKAGLYGSQLKIFKKYFPDEQLFIGDYEKLNRDSIGFLKDVFNFLGVAPFVPPKLDRVNTTKDQYAGGEDIPKFNLEIREKMKKYFESDINLLQTYTNFDVLHWLA